MISKIYVDMDGVLADFERGCCEMFPMDKFDWTEDKWEDMKRFPHFYRDLKPIEGAIEFILNLLDRYGDKVEILSAVPKKERGIDFATQDKLDWVKEWIPADIKVNLVYREQKEDFCTCKEDILVDDYDLNINDWIKKGGSGVLFKSVNQALMDIEAIDK